VSVLRAELDWTRRTRTDVFALRTLVSVGLDVLGATQDGRADGTFVAGLAQAQWAHVFGERLWGTQSVLRGDFQLTGDRLLSIERFSIGGVNTVRGYRENELVRDNGVVTSVELRVPLWSTGLGRPIVQAGPFFDWGRGWSSSRPALAPPDRTLMSVGVGVRVAVGGDPVERGGFALGGASRFVLDGQQGERASRRRAAGERGGDGQAAARETRAREDHAPGPAASPAAKRSEKSRRRRAVAARARLRDRPSRRRASTRRRAVPRVLRDGGGSSCADILWLGAHFIPQASAGQPDPAFRTPCVRVGGCAGGPLCCPQCEWGWRRRARSQESARRWRWRSQCSGYSG